MWRNLNISNSIIYSLFRETSKELAYPLGSAEHGLRNTVLIIHKETRVRRIDFVFVLFFTSIAKNYFIKDIIMGDLNLIVVDSLQRT